MTADTPDFGEPWRPAFDDQIKSREDDIGGCYAVCWRDEDWGDKIKWQRPTYRDRAISCVNACRGIADPERVVPLLVEVFKADIESQRLEAEFNRTKQQTEGIHGRLTKVVDASNYFNEKYEEAKAAIAALAPKEETT